MTIGRSCDLPLRAVLQGLRHQAVRSFTSGGLGVDSRIQSSITVRACRRRGPGARRLPRVAGGLAVPVTHLRIVAEGLTGRDKPLAGTFGFAVLVAAVRGGLQSTGLAAAVVMHVERLLHQPKDAQ